MRITREFIQKFAHEAIERRARSNRDLLAAYLCGSFLSDDFMIGGAGDIDLFIIYATPPTSEREVMRMTDDIHLDITNQDQQEYRDTRRLRVDPWIGPTLNACRILHDPQHFMDFVQASVRGQFDRADHTYQRARALADQARETWFQLQAEALEPGPETVKRYLEAVGKSANAIMSLNGPPLAERRLLIEFMPRANMLDRAGLFHGLMGLLGAPNVKLDILDSWLQAWKEAYTALPEPNRPVRFHTTRLNYYLSALKQMEQGERPFDLLWLLLNTWTELVCLSSIDSPERASWQSAFETLGLYGPRLAGRVEAFDAFLDLVEETLENWAQTNGAWESA